MGVVLNQGHSLNLDMRPSQVLALHMGLEVRMYSHRRTVFIPTGKTYSRFWDVGH
jgi:hypothetical protein